MYAFIKAECYNNYATPAVHLLKNYLSGWKSEGKNNKKQFRRHNSHHNDNHKNGLISFVLYRVTPLYCCAECWCAECRYGECRSTWINV